METIRDFEDLLEILGEHRVRYLIVGGLAFIFHAKPRFTKDMDLWVDPRTDNVERTNRALVEFGSPHLLDPDDDQEILQLGVAPNRIDILRDPASAGGPTFDEAWERRILSPYGDAEASWIDLDGLYEIKRHIDHPRHQEDARVLKLVRDRRGE
ncbi:MAG: hypothetical protein DWQ36_02860 [Acidobacteria bacterium]|nr:MAG: hypothetical protein DWQ30_02545 [Acidobacteriota bacterium]REK11067.1 MAG: hypothetical protein DWQ36_02860 [Acidobacteriota bacterium]